MRATTRTVSAAAISFLLALALSAGTAHALSEYLTQFTVRYGNTGTEAASCKLCHAASNNASSFNRYGVDLDALGGGAATGDITSNLIAVEGLDSDGVGGTNLAEIHGRHPARLVCRNHRRLQQQRRDHAAAPRADAAPGPGGREQPAGGECRAGSGGQCGADGHAEWQRLDRSQRRSADLRLVVRLPARGERGGALECRGGAADLRGRCGGQLHGAVDRQRRAGEQPAGYGVGHGGPRPESPAGGECRAGSGGQCGADGHVEWQRLDRPQRRSADLRLVVRLPARGERGGALECRGGAADLRGRCGGQLHGAVDRQRRAGEQPAGYGVW